MRLRRRLVSVAHSYVVGLNRRLAHELARVGEGRWEITAVSPAYYAGRNDLQPVSFTPLEDEPCRVVPVPAHLTQRIQLFFYGRQLRQVLREGWDLVHCWQEPFTVAGAQVALHTARETPLVYYTMQNQVRRYPPPFSWLERYCLRRCTGWLAVGRTTAEAQLQPGYSSKPSRIIPLGVALDRFRPDPAARAATLHELNWENPAPPVVGFLGRLIPEKGVQLLLRVLDSLKTPWRALFVGSGPLEAEVRTWTERHGPRARLVTGVAHADVPRYLNAMDLLCAPSQTSPRWREQQGRMLVEAWACGVPVLGSDSGEIPYVIGDAGVVVGERDEEAWAQSLAELLASPARRAELGRRGLERAHSIYAWPVVARQHLEFFEELLDGPKGSGLESKTLQGLPTG